MSYISIHKVEYEPPIEHAAKIPSRLRTDHPQTRFCLFSFKLNIIITIITPVRFPNFSILPEKSTYIATFLGKNLWWFTHLFWADFQKREKKLFLQLFVCFCFCFNEKSELSRRRWSYFCNCLLLSLFWWKIRATKKKRKLSPERCLYTFLPSEDWPTACQWHQLSRIFLSEIIYKIFKDMCIYTTVIIYN